MGPRPSRLTVSVSAVIVEGGFDGSGACFGDACGRDAWSGRVRRGGRVGAAACAAAGERRVVRAGVDRAGGSEESAADVVPVGGDAGAVRVDAAVSGRLAVGSGAGRAAVC